MTVRTHSGDKQSAVDLSGGGGGDEDQRTVSTEVLANAELGEGNGPGFRPSYNHESSALTHSLP